MSCMAHATLLDYFDEFTTSSDEFLVYDDGYRARIYRYDEVGRAAHLFADRLHESGIGKGDKVIFWAENRPEWIVALWGCLLAGVVVVPIDYRASQDMLAAFTRKFGLAHCSSAATSPTSLRPTTRRSGA